MGEVLHGGARTTPSVRREIQNSKESIMKLSKRFGINPRTVIKWRSRSDIKDYKSGPKEKFNTKLTKSDEALIISVRQKTQLPLDDCLDILIQSIPYLTRSSLHRCLQRYGLSRLPQYDKKKKREKSKFKQYDIGYVHVDITEIRLSKAEKFYLFVGICRVSKYVYVKLYDHQTVNNSIDFLHSLVKACPFKIHTILTDNGVQFVYTKNTLKRGKGPKQRHQFDIVCSKYGIKHKKTKPYTPQTNGQVERFNRTLKEATLHVYHYSSKEQMQSHINNFIIAYNCAKKLSAINRNTPMQECIKWWTKIS